MIIQVLSKSNLTSVSLYNLKIFTMIAMPDSYREPILGQGEFTGYLVLGQVKKKK